MEQSNRKPADQVTFLDQEAQDFIASIGESLTSQADVATALTRVTGFLAAEAGSVFVVDESDGDVVLRYATGEVGDKIVGLRLKSGQGVVGWVVKYSEDLIVPYPGMDTRFFEGVDASTGFSTRSILCSPMQIGDQTIGALEVLNKMEGTFNDDDQILLQAVARLMAQVLATE
jgi:sigma-B regulation protein RsbU (phosphoserine phosphatase)